MSMMQVTFLGTGTSTGIPQIGCTCPVCTSTDPRDSRLRTSAIVEIEGKNILIDCGPDFRQQMLRFHIKRIDAVLVTHIHYDDHRYPGVPNICLQEIGLSPFLIEGIEIVPIRVMHYKLPILGYRIGRFAYITDALTIPESEYEKLKDIDVLVVNALRKKPHLSHQTLADALRIIDRVGPREAYLVHMSHHMGLTSEVEKELPAHVHFAYDGLVIDSL